MNKLDSAFEAFNKRRIEEFNRLAESSGLPLRDPSSFRSQRNIPNLSRPEVAPRMTAPVDVLSAMQAVNPGLWTRILQIARRVMRRFRLRFLREEI